jgi:CO/xanthine dehydrogenase FAD-binding subunit
MLGETGTPRVVLAGGTVVNADPGFDPVEVVDLQSLGLDGIAAEGGRIRIGATTTLQTFADSPHVSNELADLARREAPSTLRTLGTIGGLIAQADGESELLAALLTYEAVVTIVGESGSADRDLAEALKAGPGGGIISKVSIETGGTAASARTGRTPGDRPIVAAFARRAGDGAIRLAISGVASVPVLVDDVAALDPPGDFRGSPEYRRHLAAVLAARVIGEVGRA